MGNEPFVPEPHVFLHQLVGTFLAVRQHQEATPGRGVGAGATLAPVPFRRLDVAFVQVIAEIEIVREDDELAALLRPEVDRPARGGKAAIDRRVRILIAQRSNTNFAHNPVRVLTLAVLRISRVACRTSIGGKFPVFALVAEDVVGPRLLDDLHALLEQRAVAGILRVPGLNIVGGGRADPFLCCIGIDPARVIAAREAAIEPAL